MTDLDRLEMALQRALVHEAELLDGGRFAEWLALLEPDVTYEVPVRVTRERGRGSDVSEMQLFQDDRETLRLRVERLRTDFAWAEDPPSRTRHFVSNVRVNGTDEPDAFEVRSYLLLYRNRGGDAGADLLSGERQDVWRRVDGGWRLARRRVLVDQATLGIKNLAVFL